MVRIRNTELFCRTDAGVHAYCNTATVDLARAQDGHHHDPKRITANLNTFFLQKHLDVR